MVSLIITYPSFHLKAAVDRQFTAKLCMFMDRIDPGFTEQQMLQQCPTGNERLTL